MKQLLESRYNPKSNKIQLHFYNFDSNRIEVVEKPYRPYFLLEHLNKNITNNKHYMGHESVNKHDNIRNTIRKMNKVYGAEPTDVIALRNEAQKPYEANIKYHLNYLYDSGFTAGCMYNNEEPTSKITQFPNKEFLHEFSKDRSPEFLNYAYKHLTDLFTTIKIPKMIAIDIEVEDYKIPQVDNPTQKIISCSFYTEGWKSVFYLGDKQVENNMKFTKEEDMIQEILYMIQAFPIIMTFNGDNFDLPYLKNRAEKLGLDASFIKIRKGWNTLECRLDKGIHLDVYKYFKNKSIKNYVYQNRYGKNSLDSISETLLGANKVKHEGVRIMDLPLEKLCEYNQVDTELTYKLIAQENFQAWTIIIMFMRMTNLPLSDLLNGQSQAWIRSMLYWEHRQRNILIPTREEVRRGYKATEESMIEGKGFKGAHVVQPVPGLHFGVVALDFASLYPSIIKEYNLSYETINCNHPECKEKNMLPGMPHWSCTLMQGMFSYMVGFYRDIRVMYFKKIAKTDSYYTPIEQALKVFINMSYGVFGSDTFSFFCLPVAESTTGIGRTSVLRLIDESESKGSQVIYGDTDSIFIINSTLDIVKELIDFCKTMDLELEHEKTFQFLALSHRKKNYIGIHDNGKIEMKGIQGKKRNTPQFIKDSITRISQIMKRIKNMKDFTKQRKVIIDELRATSYRMTMMTFPLSDYSYVVYFKKDKYDKVKPQHVRAAEAANKPYSAGESATLVKTTKPTAKLLEQAGYGDLNMKVYKSLLKNAAAQILDALGISWDEITGQRNTDYY